MDCIAVDNTAVNDIVIVTADLVQYLPEDVAQRGVQTALSCATQFLRFI